jgi:hypothetical protein
LHPITPETGLLWISDPGYSCRRLSSSLTASTVWSPYITNTRSTCWQQESSMSITLWVARRIVLAFWIIWSLPSCIVRTGLTRNHSAIAALAGEIRPLRNRYFSVSSLRDGAYAGEMQARRPALERNCGLAKEQMVCEGIMQGFPIFQHDCTMRQDICQVKIRSIINIGMGGWRRAATGSWDLYEVPWVPLLSTGARMDLPEAQSGA